MGRCGFVALSSIGLLLGCSGGDDGNDESVAAPVTESSTSSSTVPTTSTSSTTVVQSTTATSPAGQDAGGLDSATTAIRAACRQFYGWTVVDLFPDPGEEPSGTSLLTEVELVDRCDTPAVEFRSDCYADRPPNFVAADGGCAVLGGYLTVFFGNEPDGYPDDVGGQFQVGEDVWWIYPESD